MTAAQKRSALYLAMEDIDLPVFTLNAHGRIVDLNHRLSAITGFSRDDLQGKDSRHLFPDAATHPRPDPLSPTGSYRADHFVPDAVVNVARKDGSVFPARLLSTPGRSCDHGPVHAIAVLNAVQLSLDATGFRGMLESAPDATLILDQQGLIVVANQRAAVMFGTHRDQLDGRSIRSLFSPTYASDAQAWFAQRYDHLLEGGELSGHVTTFPLRAVRLDNPEEFPIEVAASAIHMGEGMFLRVAVRDITERVRLQSSADEMKAHFLATVSHELRTPLASIVGYAELLGDLPDEDLSTQARRFLHVISRNAQRELRLVDDLLTIVSIESGEMTVRPQPADLLAIAHESCEALQPAANDAGIRLDVQCEHRSVPITGDPVRLGQVLDNLIDNALKFSPPDSRITLTVTPNPHKAELTVADQGPGIPLHERLRVFDKLFRGEHATEREKAGAGLGLTIVKAIVEAHQGTLQIHCPPTGGTKVKIGLPTAMMSTPEAPASKYRQD